MQEAALSGRGFRNVLDGVEKLGDRPRPGMGRQRVRCDSAGDGAPSHELRLAEDIESTADSSVHRSLR